MKNTESKLENKETENIVKMNGKGVYVTPPQHIYIDEEGNTKEVVFEITRMKNQQLYNQSLVKYIADNDVYAFARVVLPKVINKPYEARKVDFFDYDLEALGEVISLVVEIMGKQQENTKRRLKMILE